MSLSWRKTYPGYARRFVNLGLGLTVWNLGCLGTVASLSGCAQTSLRTPDGMEYRSDKDVTIGHMEMTVTQSPDGTVTKHVVIDNSGGNASGVDAIRAQGIAAGVAAGLDVAKTLHP